MKKPIFIPLKSLYFMQFINGQKTTEYRKYGKMWNESVCTPGRQVVLSLGYSGPRAKGTIDSFETIKNRGITEIYPDDTLLAAIKIANISKCRS